MYLLEDVFGDMRTMAGAEDTTGVRGTTMTGAENMMKENEACASRKLVRP